MDKFDKEALLNRVVVISEMAGKAIMDIYNNNSESDRVYYKEDKSPLTKADMVSHHIILEELEKLNLSIPVLSEEASNIPYGRGRTRRPSPSQRSRRSRARTS